MSAHDAAAAASLLLLRMRTSHVPERSIKIRDTHPSLQHYHKPPPTFRFAQAAVRCTLLQASASCTPHKSTTRGCAVMAKYHLGMSRELLRNSAQQSEAAAEVANHLEHQMLRHAWGLRTLQCRRSRRVCDPLTRLIAEKSKQAPQDASEAQKRIVSV